MFSVKGDTVLDPFLGTGTTTLAAMASQRNSIGIEIDESFKDIIHERLQNDVMPANAYTENRIKKHKEFICRREQEKGNVKYTSDIYKFPVVTRQETKMKISLLKSIKSLLDNSHTAEYYRQKCI